jgi:hypothetical protein
MVVRSEAEETLESSDDFFTGRERDRVPLKLEIDESWSNENGL